MKKNTKYIIILIGIIIALIYINIISPIRQRNSLRKAVLIWARMAPFPEEITDFRIETAGGMFTREIFVTFKAESEVVEDWIKNSAGTKDLKPEEEHGVLIYKITPVEGCSEVELRYYKNIKVVDIYACWS